MGLGRAAQAPGILEEASSGADREAGGIRKDGIDGADGQMRYVGRWTERTDGYMGQMERCDRWTDGTNGHLGQTVQMDRQTDRQIR